MATSNIEPNLTFLDLREWLAEVERMGELRTVRGASLEQDIGMAALVVCRSDMGPAVLFDDIPGLEPGFRLLTNVFAGSRRNMTLGFGAGLNKFELSQAYVDGYLRDQQLIPPTVVPDGPVMENTLTGDDIDITRFPAPLWHDDDGGNYIGTGCYSVTKDPDSGWLNVGTYRSQVQDSHTLSVYIVSGKHGDMHRNKYRERGEDMPMVMVLGGDPVTFFSAGTEAPAGMCEFDIVGGMRGKPMEVIEGPITGLPFPANAEIVVEGYLVHDDLRPEGPFGEWTGYYASGEQPAPSMRIEAIYYRNDPIVLGVPPMGGGSDEMARYRAVMRSAMLKQNLDDAGVPDVTGVWCHEIGASRMLHGISITQRYPGHAAQAGHIASQCRAAVYSGKWVIVVDDDIDVTNLDELIWAMLTRTNPENSIDIIHNAWTSPADPRVTPTQRAIGDITNSRAIVNACRPFHWRHEFPKVNAPSPEQARKAREMFGYLLKGGANTAP